MVVPGARPWPSSRRHRLGPARPRTLAR